MRILALAQLLAFAALLAGLNYVPVAPGVWVGLTAGASLAAGYLTGRSSMVAAPIAVFALFAIVYLTLFEDAAGAVLISVGLGIIATCGTVAGVQLRKRTRSVPGT